MKGTEKRISKGAAAAATIMFMGLIRTNADWKLWQASLIALVMYEAALMSILIVRRQMRRNRRNKAFLIRQQDARRWAEEWFNPLKEVR